MAALSLLSDLLKRRILAVQDYTLLSARSLKNIAGRPRYLYDTLVQMDTIGVGSLPIVILTGLFIGAVLVLQTSAQFMTFGEAALTGDVVALSLVREIGPVITALLVAGRNASGIASELGSMVVTEQVDAMRAMGTDPTRKLVTPRVVATTLMLPLLTIVGDFVGLVGGFVVAFFEIHLMPVQFWTRAVGALDFKDLVQGLAKPFLFGFVVSSIGCYYGLTTRGGTQGVGRSTTAAVVTSSVLVLISDFFVTKFLLWALGM